MLKPKLDQKQIQKLVLAPALQQAIRLLPLTNLELIEVIDAELAENPLLEEVHESEFPEGTETSEAEAPTTMEIDQEPSSDESELTMESHQLDEPSLEEILTHYFDDSPDQWSQEPKEPVPLENILSKGPSLWDHLYWQANLTFFNEEEKTISSHIIGNINEDGYLTTSVEEIASSLGVDVAKVEAVRQKIKGFDPVGCGSLNLKEMMLAQMEYLGINNDITRKIVENYLPILEKANYDQLARELKISLAELKDHLEILKHLDPAPGRKYSQEKIAYVVPDIIVTKEGDDYRILLNNEGLPKLRISNYYRQLMAQGSELNPEAYAYLKERMKRAIWFLKSLNQREQTVYRVAKAIIERQKEFLDKGIDFLKPLTLSEIAEEVGVHESTVGRVVANKYVQTPRGVFSLKYFFHKSLASENGEEISSLRIKERIKKLIEGEDPANPLSDTELCDILRRENIKIARRTVAKYRKQLHLPPSHIRKRKFLAEGKK